MAYKKKKRPGRRLFPMSVAERVSVLRHFPLVSVCPTESHASQAQQGFRGILSPIVFLEVPHHLD